MNFHSKNAILTLIIFVWLNVGSIKNIYDPYVGIAFEEEKSNVYFMNFMWVLYLVYLQFDFSFVTPM